MGVIRVIMLSVASLLCVNVQAADVRRNIVITEVGLSKNTNRVFVKSSTLAADSACADKEHYAIALGSAESYLFYSAALTALNQGKKMRVMYDPDDECLSGSPVVKVFWGLGY